MALKVAYIFDQFLEEEANKIKPIKNRATVVHSLIEAYGLLSQMTCLPSRQATVEELLSFHSQSYVEFLTSRSTETEYLHDKVSNMQSSDDDKHESDDDEESENDNEFGIGYDCPSLRNIKQFSLRIAGGTLAAVESILSGQAKIVINWCGGWHHAQRDEASGFCYVNDIVIGIQKLLSVFNQILYVDLDCHHGDGVENAFSYSKKVFTFSVHNYEAGYFPGTGDIKDVGFGRGKFYTANMPLKRGIDNESFLNILERSISTIMTKFHADCIVVQCGADCLTGDKLGNSNITEIGLGNCIKFFLEYKLPTIFLGGGGYNITNVARCWAYLTAVITGTNISSDIPEHEYFPLYGPDFGLHITPSFRKNTNSPEYINSLLLQLEELKKYHQDLKDFQRIFHDPRQ